MNRLELNGNIDSEGKFTLHNRLRFEQWCFENKGKNIKIQFSRLYSKRSDNQNRYYWGIVIKEIGIRLRDLGHAWLTDEDVHDMMKLKFNHEQIVSEEGEVLELPKSTTSFTKAEFGEYVDRVRMWAADFLNINIPDPGEPITMTF